MEKRRPVKELIGRCKVDILCIQETKCDGDGVPLVRELGGATLSMGIVSPDIDEVVVDRLVSRWAISLHFTNVRDDLS